MSSSAGGSSGGASEASTSGAQWTNAVLKDLYGLAAGLNKLRPITEDEPVLVIELDDAALLQRQALFPGVAINKAAVAAIITQHMQEVLDVLGGPSRLLFRGTVNQFFDAVNQLTVTLWLRSMGGQHLGRAYGIMSATAVVAMVMPFNAQ
ncbi:hypothetical protein TSOC_012402 [Tetrabaena socialis]|uniref:Uncharacterized protein n=1 Tax=Tetrabaena socialis TaxID=47790 RepID=A0A2J7ZN46_9CHLO|nr:hypothetical protein TSOC_012402 [Tetrabaena socialis]|eukprot:PNH01689.1 hypothetical protein TSOC_012402 [Tetrabaena socialis]